MENTLQTELKNVLNETSEKDSIDIKASVLALQFLGLVDEKMKETGMTKNELADQIGTSVSHVTQLFRGDRKPSWEILAKMSLMLGLEFIITVS